MDWNTILVDIGQTAIPWVVTLLVGLLSKYVYSKIQNDYWRGVTERATEEVFAAAQEVHQTYVKGIKAGRADGKLTDGEKAAAKDAALKTAKSNLGSKGFQRLAKVMGGEGAADKWLGTRVESSVSALKSVSAATKK